MQSRHAGEPALSVVIANRNNAAYLPQCLESVLAQSFQDLEVVVCDDASDDSSWAVIESFAREHGPRIKALRNDQQFGVAATRHKAIEASQGLFLSTLDSDDFYRDADKLAKEMDLISHNDAEESREIVAFSDVEIAAEDGTKRGTMSRVFPVQEGDLSAAILSRSCMIPRDFIQRRSLYFECGSYDRRLSLYEDWDLKIRIARRAHFMFTGSVGTVYRRHERGLSSRGLFLHSVTLWRIFNRYISDLPEGEQASVKRAFGAYMARLITQFKPACESARKGRSWRRRRDLLSLQLTALLGRLAARLLD